MTCIVDSIKADDTFIGPYVLVKVANYVHRGLFEVLGMDSKQHGGWYVSFNGNAKQRRQQSRKLIRDLNQ